MSNSNTSAHLISVIIPIYNVEKYLAQCLASVQAQTYANLEIICVNDGSTDGSLAILEAHAAQDERITIVDKSNAGYGAACNLGLAGAHGDWISIVEPDDYLEPNTYEMLLAQADDLGGNACVDRFPVPVGQTIRFLWRLIVQGRALPMLTGPDIAIAKTVSPRRVRLRNAHRSPLLSDGTT